MAKDKLGLFNRIFLAMMMLCGLVWVWTVALIVAWPWQKGTEWKPDFRLAAVCAKGEVCGIPYGRLAEARANGAVTALVPPSDNGEVMEEDAWLRWKKVSGQPWQVESSASSWYFETSVRYRLENDMPVLVEYREVGAKAVQYGVALGAFSMVIIYLRKRRR